MVSNRRRTTTPLISSGASKGPLQRFKHATEKQQETKKASPFALDAMSPALANHILILEAQDSTVHAKTLACQRKAREMDKQVLTFDARALVYNQRALFYQTQALPVFKKRISSASATAVHATNVAYPRVS